MWLSRETPEPRREHDARTSPQSRTRGSQQAGGLLKAALMVHGHPHRKSQQFHLLISIDLPFESAR
jgi:hypothetical protein